MKSEFWKPFFHIFMMKILTKSYQVGFACSEADKRNLQPIPGTAKSGSYVELFNFLNGIPEKIICLVQILISFQQGMHGQRAPAVVYRSEVSC